MFLKVMKNRFFDSYLSLNELTRYNLCVLVCLTMLIRLLLDKATKSLLLLWSFYKKKLI